MSALSRREFLRLLGIAGAAMAGAGCAGLAAKSTGRKGLYDLPSYGDARLLHFTDCHAQLMPIYFREPSVNIGLGSAKGKLPHRVGKNLLDYAGLPLGGPEQYAYTYLDFASSAEQYGKVGGFAHLKTLVDDLRSRVPVGSSLLLDGGDTWQGSGTAYWTRGKDMVDACNLLGVDIMTGHWEFTYTDQEVLQNIKDFNGEFVAQNIRVKEDALFEGAEAFDEDSGHAFKPYTVKVLNGHRVAVIGQAFPYTPIANPSRFIPDWEFGIREDAMQKMVDQIRATEDVSAVVVLSHNGMDVDLKMAARVTGIDAILGGHTHDGIPVPVEVENSSGKTVVTNAGSNGKFLAVLDLKFNSKKVSGYQYHLLPVFSNLLDANAEMSEYLTAMRQPYQDALNEELAVASTLLYRRGNFNGTFDQIICDAQRVVGNAEIALSPGFRWGTTVLPGQAITMEHVLDQTCITYPETYVRNMSGSELKLILEDVCDNLFNSDPYYQQGGDMVRVGGLNYSCDPLAQIGSRISDMTLDNGRRIDASKTYKVAGWATVGSQAPGEPIWDIVAEYLRDQGEAKIDRFNVPKLLNIDSNPGLADYPGFD